MIRGRKIIVIIISVILPFALLLTLFRLGTDKEIIELYYFNDTMTSIISEEHQIKKESKDEMIELVLEKLSSSPSKQSNKQIIQKGTGWTISKGQEGILVDFSKDFLSENRSQNVLSAYAVIKSLCSIRGVSSVKVTAGGEDIITPENTTLSYLDGDDINLGITEKIADTKNVKLYFLDKNGELSYIWRKIKLSDTVSIGQMVVEELINGPENADYSAVLSQDTKILSFEMTEGTAYVNMSQAFIDKNKSTPNAEENAVYSIVNSLLELDAVENVQFLIEGKKVNEFETIDISVPFVRK